MATIGQIIGDWAAAAPAAAQPPAAQPLDAITWPGTAPSAIAEFATQWVSRYDTDHDNRISLLHAAPEYFRLGHGAKPDNIAETLSSSSHALAAIADHFGNGDAYADATEIAVVMRAFDHAGRYGEIAGDDYLEKTEMNKFHMSFGMDSMPDWMGTIIDPNYPRKDFTIPSTTRHV